MIRILLIDDVPVFQSMIATFLSKEEDIQIVGTARTLKDAKQLSPTADIALVNAEMEDHQALRMVRELALYNSENPYFKILVTALEETKEEVLQYIRAGAVGYVDKQASIEDLVQKVREAVAGKSRVSPTIAATLISYVNRYSIMLDQFRLDSDYSYNLTRREEEILELVSRGQTNREIAGELVIEIGTVKNHIHNILKKMGVNNRYEAATRFLVDHRMQALTQASVFTFSEQ